MPQTYQIHRVVDEETGEHQPMIVSRNSGVTWETMPVPVEEAERLYALGVAEGAKPVIRHPDGRIQVGIFVFVPEIAPGDVDPRTGRTMKHS